MANTNRAAAVPKLPPKTATAGHRLRLFTAPTGAGQQVPEQMNPAQNPSDDGADMASRSSDSPILTWQGADLPRVSPGDYQAVCVAWQGPEWCIAFRRWSLRLEFSLLDCGTLVSCFFNFGDKSRPCIQGRLAKFYRAWSLANGELPRKGQDMALETFTDPSLIYLVRVEDCTADSKQGTKLDPLIYSRATKILKIERL